MSRRAVYQCRCPHCLQTKDHPEKELHAQTNRFLSRLDEQQRRWYVALEAKKLGHGGMQRMSLITGLHVETIRTAWSAHHDPVHPVPNELGRYS